MRLPVTFKQTDLDFLINQWVKENYNGSKLEIADNSDLIK